MALYSTTLASLRALVKEVKPNASKEAIDGAINNAILNTLAERDVWADLLKIGQMSLPAPTTSGTITATRGSRLVTLAGSAWPYQDLVNTVLANPVQETGYTRIVPGSMTNIQVGTFLHLDPGALEQETVAVVEVDIDSFWAEVSREHSAGVAVKASSLAGLQLKSNNLVYTVRAIRTDGITAEIDLPWGGASVAASAYQILMAYATVHPLATALHFAWDQQGMRPLACKPPLADLQQLALDDPQRTTTGDPQRLCQMPPAEGGVVRWEVWPHVTSARQISVAYSTRWPELKWDNDRPPFFLNPAMLLDSARSEVLLIRSIGRNERQDPYYDPEASARFERRYRASLEKAVANEEGRAMTSLKNWIKELGMSSGMNDDYWRSHAPWMSDFHGY